MKETVIIGIGYKARNGKDHTAQTIIRERGSKFDIRKYGFADALKREVNEAAEKAGGMFNLFNLLQLRKLDGVPPLPSWVKYDPNPPMDDPMCPLGKQRDLLQWWGTEYRRKRNPYYWVQRLAETLDREKPQVALISDMRFPNEFQWVTSKDGYTVKVERMGFVDPSINSSHPSETALDGYTFRYEIQVLDGDIPELERCAVTVFDLIVESLTPPDISDELIPVIITP